ncbi:hypothetical protein [Spongiimicrobium salis]|uniref:hypothetical protein n=1 Tax=Spongiimicrobium salis TaxID=1667022 RepID=UPI00374D1390
MAYIYHNKETEEYKLFSSIKALSDNTGLNYDTLSYQFSRKGRLQYSKKDVFVITRTEAISSKRKK